MRLTLGLRTSYLLLFVLAFLLSVLSFVYKNVWIGAYFSNVAAGLVGSLIIIFLVDKIIERNRKSERTKVVGIALKRLRIPLRRHMKLLCSIFKASTQSKPSSLPTAFHELFNDKYYEGIAFLDFSKESPEVPKKDWFTYLYNQTKWFKERIEQIIDTYAVFLDVALLDTLEKVVDSNFLSYVNQAKSVPEIDREFRLKRVYTMFNGVESLVREHVSTMMELIGHFNSNSDSPIELTTIQGIWRDDVAPKWGSSRADRADKLKKKS